MFTDKDLKELTSFTSTAPVLSLYLNTDPSEGNSDAYRLRLRNMLKEVDLPDDLLVLERYFSLEYEWSGRGVAVFSCAPQGFFRAYPLGIPVRNLIHVGDRPNVRPLVDVMDSYGGYGVALVDKQGARLFYAHLGELSEQDGVMGEEVRRTKHGGASSLLAARSRGASHDGKRVDEVVERNVKDNAAYAVEFFKKHNVRRVLVGGTDENAKAFCAALPKSWQSLVCATFPMAVTASHAEVLEKVLEIGDHSSLHREKHLMRELINGSGKDGAKAVVGMEPTLQAANDGRVQMLVMTDGFAHPAYQCTQCGRMTVLPGQTCTHCGGTYYSLDDVRETLVNVVSSAGGDVEIVRPDPELNLTDNVGAAIRF